MNRISVIVCTHNPREELLKRTLASIKWQSLDRHEWELLVIDNKSDDNVADRFDISWHPNGRHVREESLGLTYARLRGIREATGELLVFVDDDNVLKNNYIEVALNICRDWPILGAWGGGIEPEYEVEPFEWSKPYLGMLAIRSVEKDLWSNDLNNWSAQPWGAGLCVRKCVALKYLQEVEVDPIRRALDRSGKSLSSCGDIDLVHTCPELGLGFGLFPCLSLLHIIPKGRLTEDYLVRIHEGTISSLLVLKAIRGLESPPPAPTCTRAAWNWLKSLRKARRERRFWLSEQRAFQTARELCASHCLNVSQNVRKMSEV